MSATAANKELVRRVFEETIPAGDGPGLCAALAPDFDDHDPLPGRL